MMNDADPNQYMSAAWVAAQQALNQAMPLEDDQIAAIEAHVAAEVDKFMFILKFLR